MSLDRTYFMTLCQKKARRPFQTLASLSALAMMLLGYSPGHAKAGLVLIAENSTASAGGIGSFDVVLTSTSGTFAVSGFSVELMVAANSGIKFTGASGNTTIASYLFGSVQSPPLSFGPFPGTDFTATDTDFTAPGSVMLAPGQTFGLEHVSYSIAAGTVAGPIGISIVTGNNTNISDVNANFFPVTTTNGTITVTSTAVPEPPSIFAWGIAVLCSLPVFLRQKLFGARGIEQVVGK